MYIQDIYNIIYITLLILYLHTVFPERGQSVSQSWLQAYEGILLHTEDSKFQIQHE